MVRVLHNARGRCRIAGFERLHRENNRSGCAGATRCDLLADEGCNVGTGSHK